MANITNEDALISEVLDLVNDYGYTDVSEMVVGLAVERFKDLRHYPATMEEQDILNDAYRSRYKIALAAIEIDGKIGAEGQLSHSENGISRTWSERILAYEDVIGYALSS